jgi:hypothetical protein
MGGGVGSRLVIPTIAGTSPHHRSHDEACLDGIALNVGVFRPNSSWALRERDIAGARRVDWTPSWTSGSHHHHAGVGHLQTRAGVEAGNDPHGSRHDLLSSRPASCHPPTTGETTFQPRWPLVLGPRGSWWLLCPVSEGWCSQATYNPLSSSERGGGKSSTAIARSKRLPRYSFPLCSRTPVTAC